MSDAASTRSAKGQNLTTATLGAYVGLDTYTAQVERKVLKKGFRLNVMLVGQTGSGKSTFVNTLFNSHLIDSKGPSKVTTDQRQTTEIVEAMHVIEENGVRVKLTVVDTPGFGDAINNDGAWEPITRYIRDRYAEYLRKELSPQRERDIPDTRIHCVLYFVQPTSKSLPPLDVITLQRLGEICNVVPVISKADTLTLEERDAFKNKIRQQFEANKINIYPFVDPSAEKEVIELNESMRSFFPFAIVGSERNVVIDGKAVRGRRAMWGGMVNVEDPLHCDTSILRDFLIRTSLSDLIDSTNDVHYESFRMRQLMALKEGRAAATSHPGAGSSGQAIAT